MADIRKAPDRRVLRICELHRLEEQLLALAYEHIQPVVRRGHQQKAAKRTQQHSAKTKQTRGVRST